jgi:hypothetical protein
MQEPRICEADEYAEYEGIATVEIAGLQGIAALTGRIDFAYSSAAKNGDQLVRRTEFSWA